MNWTPDQGIVARLVAESRDLAAHGDPTPGCYIDLWNDAKWWRRIWKWWRRVRPAPQSAPAEGPGWVRTGVQDGRLVLVVG